MTHLQARTELPSALQAFYDGTNEAAEEQSVHPGLVGVTVSDDDLDKARALQAHGVATLNEDTRNLRLIGDPKAEDDHDDVPGDRRVSAVTKDAGFAGQTSS
jgi:hypothetical protein